MTRILLFGKNGQVGWELQRSLAPLGEITALDADDCDFGDHDQLAEIVRAARPDAIVNAAAYTAVDRAETDSDRAHAINATAPAALAQQAEQVGAWIVHYSTDYVFNGRKTGAYSEDDAPDPLSVYGASKLAGDFAVRRIASRHLIFRTSWVFGARGGNFARTMLRLGAERDRLTVVADQVGAPTSAELIADVTAHCLRDVLRSGGADLAGLYNLAAGGEVSWHGYAQHVLAGAARLGANLKCRPEAVAPIPSTDYPLPAQRPANSRLDTAKLRRVFGVTLPDWTVHLDRMLDEIVARGTAP